MNPWIYFNEKRGVWEVKIWDVSRAVVVAEYPNRAAAFCYSAFGVR